MANLETVKNHCQVNCPLAWCSPIQPLCIVTPVCLTASVLLLTACGGAQSAGEEKVEFTVRSSDLPETYTEAMQLSEEGDCIGFLKRVNRDGASWQLDSCLSAQVNVASALCVARLGYTAGARKMLHAQVARGLTPRGHAELAKMKRDASKPGSGFSARLTAIKRAPPQYPDLAAKRRVEGWVEATFTVTREGRVTDITVTEAHPPGFFEYVTAQALQGFRYKPATLDGQPIPRACERVRLSFDLQ